MPNSEVAKLAKKLGITAAGILHTPSNLVSEALSIIREYFDGPSYAYPDFGYFELLNWTFEDVIPQAELAVCPTMENGWCSCAWRKLRSVP